ncbi:MAG: hypothetical protein Q7T74_04645 [Candidatus Saccharibacteria bacterium]|nr:hypothetical protein [Candidatus Saccharibacteria bacterium]
MNSIVVIMVIGILILGFVMLGIMAATRKKSPGLDVEAFRSKWLKIEASIIDDEASCHLAILNADKLLGAALQARGFSGQTMGERMKSARSTFSNNNAVWAAHKLRNQIAHEPDVSVKPKTARYALKAFKQALKDVGAL